jgi:uncharacterized protein (DUF1015 family)
VTEIRPFAGIRYRVEPSRLSEVLAPPYDVITAKDRQALAARHPKNAVRLVLAESAEEAAYARVGEILKAWREEKVLVDDREPALYLLEQSFEVMGETRVRRGLLARFRAEDPERRVVLPHEQTRKAPREDRLRMLRATRVNFSPIFIMVRDAQGRLERRAEEIAKAEPEVSFTDDGGVGHRMWVVTDAAAVSELQGALGAAAAYIADGHHRYATALRFRDETGPDGAWTLGYFTALESPGLVVLPYHRILSAGPSLEQAAEKLAPAFDVTRLDDPGEAARAAARSDRRYAFGLAQPGAGALVAESKQAILGMLAADAPPSLRALDPWVFHTLVLEQLLGIGPEAVDYVHSLAEAEEAVASGGCRLAGLLRPTPVQQIVDVAEAGESMPAKSTFFHPKLPSGLVIHPLLV